MRRILLLMAPVVLVSCAGAQLSTSSETDALVPAASAGSALLPPGLTWGPAPPSLPPGARVAVLDGDPSKAELFTMRALLPHDYRVPPHWHPSHERVTILSGIFQVGMGDTFDLSRVEEVAAGGFTRLDPRMNHFIRVIGETVIQVHGMGPWQVNYVNAADDPRNR